MKNLFVHVLRGAAYITLPVGTILLASFLLTAFGMIGFYEGASAFVIDAALSVITFILPTWIILFVHKRTQEKNTNAVAVIHRPRLGHIIAIVALILIALIPVALVVAIFSAAG